MIRWRRWGWQTSLAGLARRAQDPTLAAYPGMPRPLHTFALVSLAIYLAVMTLPYKVANNDIWIHLKTGEYVLTNGWVPIKDPYSFMAADHDYVAHEWLAGVLFYLAYATGGVAGLIVLKSAILVLVSGAKWCGKLLWLATESCCTS